MDRESISTPGAIERLAERTRQRRMYCLSCHCPYSFSEPPEGPQGTCLEETCPCHTAYWQTVPENVKRRLWGDR